MPLTIRATEASNPLTQSGFLVVGSVLTTPVITPASVTPSITLTGSITGSPSSSFPLQLTSPSLLVLIPTQTCTFSGTQTTQDTMLNFFSMVTMKNYHILYVSAPASPYLSTVISCPDATPITYYERTSSTAYAKSDAIFDITSTMATFVNTSPFSISTSQTSFISLTSVTGAHGVLALNSLTNVAFPTGYSAANGNYFSLTLELTAGITITNCGARYGFLTEALAEMQMRTYCQVISGTKITISNFYALSTTKVLSIELIYNTDSAVYASTPTLAITLMLN